MGRNLDGSFTDAAWVPIAYPGQDIGPTSGNTVYENYVLGVYGDPDGTTQGYVATVPEPAVPAILAAGVFLASAVARLRRRAR